MIEVSFELRQGDSRSPTQNHPQLIVLGQEEACRAQLPPVLRVKGGLGAARPDAQDP